MKETTDGTAGEGRQWEGKEETAHQHHLAGFSKRQLRRWLACTPAMVVAAAAPAVVPEIVF